MFHSSNNLIGTQSARSRGFTLVELLISVAIIMILSLTLYAQQSKFDSSIYIKNTAQQIALAIRESQTYSVSSVGGSEGTYGIHFSNNSKEFTFFQDSNGDGIYASSTDKMIKTHRLKGSNQIGNKSIVSNTNSYDCSTLTITFKRPNPEPTFRCDSNFRSGRAEIVLGDSNDNTVTKKIKVSATGQIQVE